MKSRLLGVVVAITLLAGNAYAAGGLRIGVVNMQRAVSETEEGKAAEKQLNDLKQKLEAEINRKLKEFSGEEEKLRKSWSILKDEEKRKRAEDSQKKYQELQKRYVEAERELMDRKTNIMVKIGEKLNKIIQNLAQRDKYDYIFANEALLWAPPHVDLTNEVIREYNKSKGGK